MPEGVYPEGRRARTRWIESLRGPRNVLDPRRAYGVITEQEVGPTGSVEDGCVVLTTNRECPWHCLMCDLWRNTLETSGPAGSIVEQVTTALAELGDEAGQRIKLYNAGSFFDTRSIPPDERDALIELLDPFDRVIVECHPALVGDAVWRFRDRLRGRLEVALGLETADPVALAKLNKGMNVDDFVTATRKLGAEGVDARAFVLVRTPFQSEDEGAYWALRSVDVAAEAGCDFVALLPTRAGNGAMEALAATGHWAPPSLDTVEDVFDEALQRNVRVTVDLWDLAKSAGHTPNLTARTARLEAMNLAQRPLPRVIAGAPRAPKGGG